MIPFNVFGSVDGNRARIDRVAGSPQLCPRADAGTWRENSLAQASTLALPVTRGVAGMTDGPRRRDRGRSISFVEAVARVSRVIRGALCADTLDEAGCNIDTADCDDRLKLGRYLPFGVNLWKLAKLARRVAFSERRIL